MIKLPFIDKELYCDFLTDFFNCIENSKSFKQISELKDKLCLYSNENKKIVIIETFDKSKSEFEQRITLKKKVLDFVFQLKSIDYISFTVILNCNQSQWLIDDAQMLKIENYFEFEINYWSWEYVTTKILENEIVLSKYYKSIIQTDTNSIGKINSIYNLNGNENIILQDVHNSLVVVNANNSEQLIKLFEPTKNKVEELKDLIVKSIENNDIRILLLKILTLVIPNEYHAERKKYNEKLVSLFDENVMNNKSIKLSELYVEPDFKIFNTCFDKKDIRIEKKDKTGFVTIKDKNIHEFVYETIIYENTLQLPKIPQVIFILGYPGQGKTSFCKRLLYDLLNTDNYSKNIYFFRLRNITKAKQLIDDPLYVLREQAEFETDIKIDKTDFSKSLLILDGLDELYMKENLKLDDIDFFCKELVRTTNQKPDLQIILTSRYGYIDINRFGNIDVLILQLKEFNIAQQILWLKKYKSFADTWLTTKQLVFYSSSAKVSYVKELLGQPLLLFIICSIDQDIDNNTNKSKIYSQLFTELLERNYDNGKLDVYEKIDTSALRKLIQEIAFAIFQTGNDFIRKSQLEKLESVEKFLTKFPTIEYKNSLKGIMMSFYFQESRQSNENDNDYAIEFLHKSLQEFMVAEKIYENVKFEFTTKSENNDYIIDDTKRAFEVVFPLFSKRLITIEIQSFIIELIKNDDTQKVEHLSERLNFFFPQLLKNDFLFSYNIKEFYLSPLSIIKNSFIGYWTLLVNCSPKQNFLINAEIKKNFALLLRLILSDEFKNKEDSYEVETFNFPLGYQELPEEMRFYYFATDYENKADNRYLLIHQPESSLKHWNTLLFNKKPNGNFHLNLNTKGKPNVIDFFEYLDEYKSKIINADISNQNDLKIEISNAQFINVDFGLSVFNNSTFNDVVFVNCNFMYAEIICSTFNDVSFINCSLHDNKITNLVFNDVRFLNCNLHLSHFINSTLNDINFQNTKLIDIDLDHCTINAFIAENCIMKNFKLIELNIDEITNETLKKFEVII